MERNISDFLSCRTSNRRSKCSLACRSASWPFSCRKNNNHQVHNKNKMCFSLTHHTPYSSFKTFFPERQRLRTRNGFRVCCVSLQFFYEYFNGKTMKVPYCITVYFYPEAASEEEQRHRSKPWLARLTGKQILRFSVCGLHTVCLATFLIGAEATSVPQLRRLVWSNLYQYL